MRKNYNSSVRCNSCLWCWCTWRLCMKSCSNCNTGSWRSNGSSCSGLEYSSSIRQNARSRPYADTRWSCKPETCAETSEYCRFLNIRGQCCYPTKDPVIIMVFVRQEFNMRSWRKLISCRNWAKIVLTLIANLLLGFRFFQLCKH